MHKQLVRVALLAAILVALGFAAPPAQADVGPKPGMHFTIRYEGEPVELKSGLMIVCEDAACSASHPLPDQFNFSFFTCFNGECRSQSFYYGRYQKVVLLFADRTRESNVFERRPQLGGEYRVTVRAGDLLVEQTPDYTALGLGLAGALVGTLLIELVVAGIIVLRRRLGARVLVAVIVANLISVPIVWLLTTFIDFNPLALTAAAEVFAIVFEAGFIYYTNRRVLSPADASVISLLMNLISWSVGWLLGSLLG